MEDNNYLSNNLISLSYTPKCSDSEIKDYYLQLIGNEEQFNELSEDELYDIEDEIFEYKLEYIEKLFKDKILTKMNDEIDKIEAYLYYKFNYELDWQDKSLSNYVKLENYFYDGISTSVENNFTGVNKNVPEINNLMCDYLNYAFARIGYKYKLNMITPSTYNEKQITKDEVFKLDKQDFSKFYGLTVESNIKHFAKNHNLGNFTLLDKQDAHQR